MLRNMIHGTCKYLEAMMNNEEPGNQQIFDYFCFFLVPDPQTGAKNVFSFNLWLFHQVLSFCFPKWYHCLMWYQQILPKAKISFIQIFRFSRVILCHENLRKTRHTSSYIFLSRHHWTKYKPNLERLRYLDVKKEAFILGEIFSATFFFMFLIFVKKSDFYEFQPFSRLICHG